MRDAQRPAAQARPVAFYLADLVATDARALTTNLRVWQSLHEWSAVEYVETP
jgi:hypothetical protein